MKNHFLQKLLLCIFTSFLSAINAYAGFYVSGTRLMDSNGNNFMMRGINHAHAWYPEQSNSINNIAAKGANTVRLVLANGDQWTRTKPNEISDLILQCKAAKLICVLEVHDATGFGDAKGAGSLANAAQFWVDNASVLKGEEDYVIINIANEPFGNYQGTNAWVNGHISAIKKIREAGLTHTIMVDAPSWGQDWENIMLNNAKDVAASDSQRNTIFSVHMYESYQNYSSVESYVNSFQAKGLPLIIGEFGPSNNGSFVDADSILAVAQAKGVGYIGWSWSGNGSCCTALDIVNNFNENSLTSWGNRLINGANGISLTSKIASVYTSTNRSSANNSSSSSITSTASNVCNWYGSLFPVCVNNNSGWGWENNQSCIAVNSCTSGGGTLTNGVNACGTAANGYPQCCNGNSSDPDGDGWGWENNKSCIVSPESNNSSSRNNSSLSSSSLNSSNDSGSCGTASNGYPNCCNGAGSDPDGDGWGWENSQSCVVSKSSATCNWNGNNYPICASSDNGWGWENNQSCIGKSLCANGNDSGTKWESLIDGNSFSNYSTFEKYWNYLYPWGSDHNGTARMYGSASDHKQVYIETGSVLVLKATPASATEGKSKADPYLTIKYHSGAIHAKTQVLVSDQFPNWEVRGEFQAPTTKGTWPAFWLSGAWTWPPELDILEFKGNATNWFNTFRSSSDVSSTKVSVSSPNNWHQYRAWITKVNTTDVDVHYYIDEKWYAVHRANGFVGKPMWVIINLQMEGSAGAPGPVSDTYYRARNVYIGRTRTY